MAYEFGEKDLRAYIKVRLNSKFIETSVGRILFNETLPENYPFVNELMNSRKLEKIVAKVIENYDQRTIEDTLDKIKDLG
ncbi:unnamed protein product, partial [marine sediment metagenome]